MAPPQPNKRLTKGDLRITYRTFRPDYAQAAGRFERCVFFGVLATIVRFSTAPHADFFDEDSP